MKQQRKPTRKEKEFLSKKRLNPDNWMVQPTKEADKTVFVHKISGKTIDFDKIV